MSRKRLSLLAGITLASAVLVPAAAFGGAQAATTHTVTLKEFRFHPGTLTIRRGEKVTWLWRDQTEHNVTFHSSHSRTQESGSYTIRFTHSGTFNYRCTIHAEEGMRGKIVVH
ncbi:MAG: cupredoxin domain-containing protein [Solirubrobacterales bacterium]|nr:cupredoxin domain-containing protein [Solirubrobacterales bacterium]